MKLISNKSFDLCPQGQRHSKILMVSICLSLYNNVIDCTVKCNKKDLILRPILHLLHDDDDSLHLNQCYRKCWLAWQHQSYELFSNGSQHISFTVEGSYSACRMLWLWTILLPELKVKAYSIQTGETTAPVVMRLLTRWTSWIVFNWRYKQFYKLPSYLNVMLPAFIDSSGSNCTYRFLTWRGITGEKLHVEDKTVDWVWSIEKQSDWPAALLSVSLSADELSPELQKRGGGYQEETTHNHKREGGLWSVCLTVKMNEGDFIPAVILCHLGQAQSEICLY